MRLILALLVLQSQAAFLGGLQRRHSARDTPDEAAIAAQKNLDQRKADADDASNANLKAIAAVNQDKALVDQAADAITQAQQDLTDLQTRTQANKAAFDQATSDLDTQLDLNKTADAAASVAAIKKAYADQNLAEADAALDYAQDAVENATEALADAQDDLPDAQSDFDDANASLALAQQGLSDATTDVSPLADLADQAATAALAAHARDAAVAALSQLHDSQVDLNAKNETVAMWQEAVDKQKELIASLMETWQQANATLENATEVATNCSLWVNNTNETLLIAIDLTNKAHDNATHADQALIDMAPSQEMKDIRAARANQSASMANLSSIGAQQSLAIQALIASALKGKLDAINSARNALISQQQGLAKSQAATLQQAQLDANTARNLAGGNSPAANTKAAQQADTILSGFQQRVAKAAPVAASTAGGVAGAAGGAAGGAGAAAPSPPSAAAVAQSTVGSLEQLLTPGR